ncbi:MAG TPA: flagellar biosynthesis anti-sigma factor FlgM [Candidatus Acidoferrum sp.]|nr:flagellar biosynthesis anti-sigma factor FlgM [Candidatus Acidoferrum sp.]
MRIDPNQFLGNLQQDAVQQANTRGIQPSQSEESRENGAVDGDDQFQPSQALDQVQKLKAQLAQMPEVRSDRVAVLSQKIQQGSYKPTNEQIANAMVSEITSNKRS